VCPVRYEMGFYISEGGILHSHRRQDLISYDAVRRLSVEGRLAIHEGRCLR
jgi:hypothetical protein